MGGWLGENAWHGAAGRRRARGYWRGLGLGGEGEGQGEDVCAVCVVDIAGRVTVK